MMRIGDVAEQTSLSLRSLRHWDEVGLVAPSGRTEGGFRLYTEADVSRIMVVRRMKPLGYTLDEMRTVLDVVDALRVTPDDAELRAALQGHLEEATARREKLAIQVERADDFLAQLRAV